MAGKFKIDDLAIVSGTGNIAIIQVTASYIDSKTKSELLRGFIVYQDDAFYKIIRRENGDDNEWNAHSFELLQRDPEINSDNILSQLDELYNKLENE